MNRKTRKQRIVAVSLSESASSDCEARLRCRPEDQLRAFYHAYLFRQLLQERSSPLSLEAECALLNQSYDTMMDSFSHFRHRLEKAGWDCHDLFLEERDRRFSKSK